MKRIIGIDEAGRGSLVGDAYVAGVIFPEGYKNNKIKDSKKLTHKKRSELTQEIERDALVYFIETTSPNEIDKYNIHEALFNATHRGLGRIENIDLILIDGNSFRSYDNIEHKCIVKGDDKDVSIGAASVLVKYYRDKYIIKLSEEYPVYNWHTNKGYPQKYHIQMLNEHGITKYHRKSYKPVKQILNE